MGNNIFAPIDTLIVNKNIGFFSSFHIFDINRDGLHDLVFSGREIALINDGLNNFNEVIELGRMPSWDDIVLKDIDSDGFADLYGIDNLYNGVFKIMSSESGELLFESLYKSPLAKVIGKASGDLNGDGLVDMVFSGIELDDENQIFWFSNDGNGSFIFENILSSSSSNYSHILLEDVDDDGDLDIINSSLDSPDILILINNGGGLFSVNFINTSFRGLQEIVYINFDKVILGLSIDNETVADEFVVIDISNMSDPSVEYGDISTNDIRDIELADVNGDNIKDVIAYERTDTNRILVYYDGDENTPVAKIIDSDFFILDAIPVDIDNDGDIDFIETESFFGPIEFLINNGSGDFTVLSTNIDIGSNFVGGLADIDKNGYVDIIDSGPGQTFISYNDKLSFTRELLFAEDQIRGFYASDVDGDGDVDIVNSSSSLNEISLFRNQLITATKDIEKDVKYLSPYPNPTNSVISFKTDTFKKGIVEIYEISGKKISEHIYKPNIQLDMSRYQMGVYLIKLVDLSTRRPIAVSKIVKID